MVMNLLSSVFTSPTLLSGLGRGHCCGLRSFFAVSFRSEMAGNPRAEALRRNIAFIQESMATGGLSTIASHLLQLDLITGQNYRDSLAPCGRGPDDQAAMLMRTVESRIRNSPDVYFSRFIEALRRSNLGYVADRLVQALEETEDQRHSSCKWSGYFSHDIKPIIICLGGRSPGGIQ